MPLNKKNKIANHYPNDEYENRESAEKCTKKQSNKQLNVESHGNHL